MKIIRYTHRLPDCRADEIFSLKDYTPAKQGLPDKKMLRNWYIKRPVLVFAALLLLMNVNSLSAQMPTEGKGTVAEVINVGNYVYVRLEQPQMWIASSPTGVAIGDLIDFGNGAEMRNFYSAKLDRTFESILFVPQISIENRNIDSLHRQATIQQGADHPIVSNPAVVAPPLPGEITALKDGKTVAEILLDQEALDGSSISLRAKIVKVNENIMGRNWMTLQDGSGTNPEDKLIATSTQSASAGDVVIASGIVRRNVDIGSGYRYEVLLEDARFE